MNKNFIPQVDLSDDESNLNISQQSYNREVQYSICGYICIDTIFYKKFFKLNEYTGFKANQIVDIKKCINVSEEINDKVKDFHSLMINKDIDFFAQYIDDLYIIGTDIFNAIEIIKNYEETQQKELQQCRERIDKTDIQLQETANQKKYHNINIQEVELDAMFEEMKELENERISLAEGFDPMILSTINIPNIDDSLNLVFLWCTIALYGNYKEDYYWENFKEQVFRKNAVEDFLQRLLYKKASRMSRDQSFIAAEILNKQEEFLEKPYLKKKQKPQLEKLFLFIKNVNECWTISQEIRIKVLYFDQVQKEFLEIEVMKAEQEAEIQIYQDKLKQFELTMETLNEGRKFLETQLTEMVELQQNGEQHLLYLNEAQRKYFPYYDKMTIGSRVHQIEDMVYGRVTQDHNSLQGLSQQAIIHQNLRDSQILLMNQHDINSLDGQTIPTFRSTHHITQKIQPINLEDMLSIGQSDMKEDDTVRNLKQFQNFDAEAELDKSQNSIDQDKEDEDDDEKENKGKKDEDKDDGCYIF